MSCYPCPKADQAEALAADSRRQVDQAWTRLRAVWESALAAGVDVGDDALTDHFVSSMAVSVMNERAAAALEDHRRAALGVVHQLEDAVTAGSTSKEEAWDSFVAWTRKRARPQVPTLAQCRDEARKTIKAALEPQPRAEAMLDPYGTEPMELEVP